jgi:hypothetical protein
LKEELKIFSNIDVKDDKLDISLFLRSPEKLQQNIPSSLVNALKDIE